MERKKQKRANLFFQPEHLAPPALVCGRSGSQAFRLGLSHPTGAPGLQPADSRWQDFSASMIVWATSCSKPPVVALFPFPFGSVSLETSDLLFEKPVDTSRES